MTPRCLLLAVSAICLLVLAPTTALSQDGVDAGCGTANIDGIMAPGEWNDAARVALTPYVGPGNAEVTGWLHLMNDETRLYVATELYVDNGTAADASHWDSVMEMVFTDEPNALDDEWAAGGCGPPLPAEGVFMTHEWTDLNCFWFLPQSLFRPYYETGGLQGFCTEQPLAGVEWEAALAGGVALVWEWEVDLTASELDKVGPGDCFRIGVEAGADVCQQGSDCTDEDNWLLGWGIWPETLLDPQQHPDGTGTVCLNPCEVEFVPEPATIMLLGSGLASLAGYATLRWRPRRQARDGAHHPDSCPHGRNRVDASRPHVGLRPPSATHEP